MNIDSPYPYWRKGNLAYGGEMYLPVFSKRMLLAATTGVAAAAFAATPALADGIDLASSTASTSAVDLSSGIATDLSGASSTNVSSGTATDLSGAGSIDQSSVTNANVDGINLTVITVTAPDPTDCSNPLRPTNAGCPSPTPVDLNSEINNLVVSADDQLVHGSGSDQILGISGSDPLPADSGNDQLVGASGNDQLLGGSGTDSLATDSTKTADKAESVSDDKASNTTEAGIIETSTTVAALDDFWSWYYTYLTWSWYGYW